MPKKKSLFAFSNAKALKPFLPIINGVLNARNNVQNTIMPILGLKPVPEPITFEYDKKTGLLAASSTLHQYGLEWGNWFKETKEVVDSKGQKLQVPLEISDDDATSGRGTIYYEKFKDNDGLFWVQKWVLSGDGLTYIKEGEPYETNEDGTPVKKSGAFQIFIMMIIFVVGYFLIRKK